MKKVVLTLAIALLSTVAFSQVTFKPGVRAGAYFAYLSDTNGDTKTDFYIGAFGELKLGNVYALQPEINYSRQGAKNPGEGDDAEIQYVGLSLANKFSPFKEFGLHLIIGPGIDVKVSDNLSGYDTAPLDFSFFGGIGFDFPMGLSVEARYKQGIIDVKDGFTELGGDYDEDNWLNGVFQVGVSYKFDFSK
jgi:hypothetical protein